MVRRFLALGLATLLTVAVCAVFLPTASYAATCGGVETSVIDCGDKASKDAIFDLIKLVIRIMTAGVGILAVGAVIFGGILYAGSGDKPANLERAKAMWTNTTIGLLLFAFMAALVNFLVPGGVF